MATTTDNAARLSEAQRRTAAHFVDLMADRWTGKLEIVLNEGTIRAFQKCEFWRPRDYAQAPDGQP